MSGFKYTKGLLIAIFGAGFVKRLMGSRKRKTRVGIFKILMAPMKSKSSTPRE